MALEEKSVVDKVEVLLDGVIQVRIRHQILRGEKEIAATFERYTLAPGEDVSAKTTDARVNAIAAATWTDEVIAAYEASQTPAE